MPVSQYSEGGALTLTIKYKGIIDMEALYRVVYDWLMARGYQVHESKYKRMIKTEGRDKIYSWTAWRRVTEYVMLWINIDWQFGDCVDIEIVKDGQKKKLTKCIAFIRLYHELEFDHYQIFNKSKLGIQIMTFFTNWMYRKKIDTMWEDKLRFKLYELQDLIKQTLNSQIAGNEHFDVW